ncbi:MAG: glycoside hydrolase family 31 protein [Cardiobacteriaceae bacterium]|nr:glycoside hydrolase family 31 protein [Cardiobacteriaceae bacterium]
MKTLWHWSLESEHADGVTLLCDKKHRLHIIALEDYLWRFWCLQDGKSKLSRSWLVSPETAPVPNEGRARNSRAGFTCPPLIITKVNDTLVLTGNTLRLIIHNQPLWLEWQERQDADWNTIAADRPTGAYQLGQSRSGIAHFMRLDNSDHYFGLGEKAGTVDRFGKRYEMRSLDAMGYNAESTDPLYKHWPFYQTRTHTGAHYGLFYDNLTTSYFDMGNELDNYHPRYRSYHAEDGDLDYYFIHGASILDITRRFVALTGKHIFPPKWSLGYSGSTMSYTDAPDAQEQLQNFIRLCHEHGIPCDSFQFSSGYTSINGKRYVFHWNRDKIPEPQALAAAFRDAGIRLAANIKPCLLHDHPRYQEISTAGLFIKDSESDAPEQSMFWDDTGSHLDFTNPATAEWWQENIRHQLLDNGISATWNDNNEYEIWDGAARCYGFGQEIPIRYIRPLMPLLMMRNSHAAQSKASNERPYLISRSGCPGMQRYVQTWSGDNRTSWHTLKWNIRMGVGMSLSGMYHLGHDIGGFAGGKPDAELFLRWIQSALLLPRFTIHSWNDDGSVNEPWMHPSVTHAVRDAIALRYRLLPTLYTLLWQAHVDDEPYLRATFLDHEYDKQTFADTDDYLIGRTLLVCPVTEANSRNRTCYLPDNHEGWYDYYTGQYHSGGQTLNTPAPLEHLPLFVRAGSLLAEGNLMHADSPEQDLERTLRFYPLRGNGESQGVLYDDNGTNSQDIHWQLHWRMRSTATALYLHLDGSGDYHPAYLDNLQLTLPPDEHRRLIVSGNIQINGAQA